MLLVKNLYFNILQYMYGCGEDQHTVTECMVLPIASMNLSVATWDSKIL